ncbi:hypothetical protein [Eubacterium oxidoreducens]|nr:hypothetical protein [Eubacterium oxidoreducens]
MDKKTIMVVLNPYETGSTNLSVLIYFNQRDDAEFISAHYVDAKSKMQAFGKEAEEEFNCFFPGCFKMAVDGWKSRKASKKKSTYSTKKGGVV